MMTGGLGVAGDEKEKTYENVFEHVFGDEGRVYIQH